MYDICLSILKKADEISLEFETAAGTTTSQKFEYPASMFDTDYQITVMQSQHQGFSINGSKETTLTARALKGQPLSLQIEYAPEWLEADEATVSISLVESGIVVQELRLTGQGLAPSAIQSIHAESQIAVESAHDLQLRSAF